MKLLFAALIGIALAGFPSCAANPAKSTLLTYEQAAMAPEPEVALRIAEIDKALNYYRLGLAIAVQSELLDKTTAEDIIPDLKAADYFMCAAWKAMVEDDVPGTNAARRLAEHGLKIIEEKLEKALLNTKGSI